MADREQKQTRQAIETLERMLKEIKYTGDLAISAVKEDVDIADAIVKKHSSANQVASPPSGNLKQVTNIYFDPDTNRLKVVYKAI